VRVRKVNTLRLKHVVLCGLLVASVLAPAWGAFQGRPAPGAARADVFGVVPADSVFCLRINNFDYTISQMDQFITGLSPVPLGLPMMVRMLFGGITGDPQLAGVNMNGTFGAFSLPMPGAADPNDSVFTGLLIPVTTYDAFVASPTVGPPDARGISQITPQATMFPIPPMVATQAGGFALVTGAEYADMLATVADSISSGSSPALGSIPGVTTSDVAAAPIWVFIDAQKAATMAPAAAAMPAGPGALPMGAGMMNLDVASMAKNVPVMSMTLGLEPKPNVFTIMARVSAIPGTELAQTFVRGSAPMQEIYDSIGARTPAQAGAQLSAVSALLPKASQADVVGTYDLIKLNEMVGSLGIPINLPQPAAPSKSAIAYALTVDSGRLAADIALPKEHVTEIVAYLGQLDMGAALGAGPGDSMTMEVNTTQADVPDAPDDEPDDEIAKITASPFGDLPRTTVVEVQPKEVTMPVVETNTSLFGDGGLAPVTSTAAPTQVANQKVRVAGVRLIRYSDLKLGVLPLGRGDGYTLSLIADLPGPAVKVAGGQVEKALTNNGKSLLPEDQWDRKVRFGRLSKDYKTAVFDVELLLPDQGTLGLEELAGTLEYLTATGTKDVDLGALALKAGANAAQLGARISSIEIDPYENNAPVVALTLNIPGETVESVELYDKSGQKLRITQYGNVSHGNTATVRFFVDGELPAEARIVVHIFEGLQKHNLPFTIKAISIAGLPMR